MSPNIIYSLLAPDIITTLEPAFDRRQVRHFKQNDAEYFHDKYFDTRQAFSLQYFGGDFQSHRSFRRARLSQARKQRGFLERVTQFSSYLD